MGFKPAPHSTNGHALYCISLDRDIGLRAIFAQTCNPSIWEGDSLFNFSSTQVSRNLLPLSSSILRVYAFHFILI
jgi:hypothetical protein